MGEDIIIRAAQPSDAPALAELRWEFRAGKEPAVEDHSDFVARCAVWMARELARGEWRAWAADRRGTVVGQAWMRVIEKVPNPNGERDRHAYVSNVYVKPDARGGVGTQLLQAALRYASDHQIDRVVLWPTRRSRSMYGRHGFRPDGDVMELAIHSTTTR
jgi:GNAT superfamily N-acetyltransferase